MKRSVFARYSYTWVTLAFFIFSLALHWLFGWYAYVDEQNAHAQPIELSSYSVEMLRDTFENWQSEFLQLIWQVAGLAVLLHYGSPQSREGDERKEAKLDAILMLVAPDKAPDIIRVINNRMGADTPYPSFPQKQ